MSPVAVRSSTRFSYIQPKFQISIQYCSSNVNMSLLFGLLKLPPSAHDPAVSVSDASSNVLHPRPFNESSWLRSAASQDDPWTDQLTKHLTSSQQNRRPSEYFFLFIQRLSISPSDPTTFSNRKTHQRVGITWTFFSHGPDRVDAKTPRQRHTS